MRTSPKVVILGAGYAGVSAAKRLARSTAQVTIVNPRDAFVERIRLHQLMAGNYAATRPLTALLPRATTFVRDAASSINPDRREVTLTSGEKLTFDYLIYAVGSRSRPDTVPGARQHAVTVGDLEDAVLARQRFHQLPKGSAVTIIGAGLTGVELAAELAEPGNHTVRLVTSGPIAASVGDRGRAYIRSYLATLGVEIVEHTAVAEVQECKVLLHDGRVLDNNLSVLATEFEVPTLARDSGLEVGAGGALRVKPSLISTTSSDVVGAGDSVWIGAGPVRMSCQAAIPLGTHAAETVLHLIDGADPKPVRPKFTGQCISLGRRSALWQHATFSDTPTAWKLTGKPGAWLKEQLCASTIRLLLNPRLGRLAYGWS
jgi:NADH dehydrogenase